MHSRRLCVSCVHAFSICAALSNQNTGPIRALCFCVCVCFFYKIVTKYVSCDRLRLDLASCVIRHTRSPSALVLHQVLDVYPLIFRRVFENVSVDICACVCFASRRILYCPATFYVAICFRCDVRHYGRNNFLLRRVVLVVPLYRV